MSIGQKIKEPLLFLRLISAVLFLIFLFAPSFIFQPISQKAAPFFDSKISLENISQGSSFYLAKKSQPESPDFLLIAGQSLRASSPPVMVTPQVLGALIGGIESGEERKAIAEYVVESGDTLWAIAEEFNISLETLLWANNLSKSSTITPGQTLVVLPVSGTVHHVKAGDTVSGIAQKYKAKTDKIISFNELSGEADIFVGDILVIPDGVMPSPSYSVLAPALVPLASSYFICPISLPCRITQGLHWYNAVDFSHGQCQEPIYSVAQGKVLKVKLTNSTSRWALGGAGNHLTILHPNGVVTSYSHLSNSLVSPGDKVFQGQIIAFMGGQPGTPGAGKSTGCHLHFAVSGARNPFGQ